MVSEFSMTRARPLLPLFFLSMAILCHERRCSAAERDYEVKPGDSIAKIAHHFGVSQADLCDANDLGREAVIAVGDTLVIPDALRGGASKSHRVRSGDTLTRISKKYKVPVAELAAANRLGKKARLAVGRILIIPGPGDGTASRDAPTGGGSRVRKGQGRRAPPSKVRFVRVHNNKRLSLRLLNRNGRVIDQSRRALSRLCRDRQGRKRFRMLHPRLIQMLQRIADRFPGETIEIVSGYRAPRPGHRRSNHSRGRAIDFRVSGVSNKTLYEFVRSLPNTGAGYYPNSVFVHMDVRDRPFTWTDHSAPGESPRYETASTEGTVEAEEDVENASSEPIEPVSGTTHRAEEKKDIAPVSDPPPG